MPRNGLILALALSRTQERIQERTQNRQLERALGALRALVGGRGLDDEAHAGATVHHREHGWEQDRGRGL